MLRRYHNRSDYTGDERKESSEIKSI